MNDRFGHQAGDEVLVDLASGLGSVVRRNEMFFRLPGTSSRSRAVGLGQRTQAARRLVRASPA